MQRKTVIVTGAAAGIGLATVHRFAENGAYVFGLDKNEAILSLNKEKTNVVGIQCDVTDMQQLSQAISLYCCEHHIDVLVNNAGINTSPSKLSDTSEKVWQQLLDTNLTSIYRLIKLVLEKMSHGCIINISSILALGGARNNAAYAATKGAIISLTRAMARDYAPSIRVNCVCPGAVQTAMFDEYLQRCSNPLMEKERIRQSLPLQRLGTPQDIAEAVVFLASDAASWITGQILVVDGGDTA